MAQFTELQTLEDTQMQLPGDRMDGPLKPRGGQEQAIGAVNAVRPQILLNVPSDAILMPAEGILSPIEIGRSHLLNLEKFKLRSPSKATQEEIDLTKRYMYMNEQVKQSKIIKQSVIKGRRYTSQHAGGLPLLARDLHLSNLPITDDQLSQLPREQRAQIQITLKQANPSKFMPIRLDPGTMMKPKSKMRAFAKDEAMSESNSQLNKSARVATMLSHTKNKLDASRSVIGEEPPGRGSGIRQWGTGQKASGQYAVETVPMHEKTVLSTKVGFHENSAAFMRSGDLSTRSRNPSDLDKNASGFKGRALKIEGSPLAVKTLLMEAPLGNSPLLPPMPMAPSRTYAYQVSQLSVHDKQELQPPRLADGKNATGASKRGNPKVVVSNATKGAIHHSTSKDVLNDDMREVFSAGSKLA